MREVVTARKMGTVEKWTFQLITPRGRLSLIAPAPRPVMKGREEEEEEEMRRRVREGKSRLARFINFTGTKELFKLQRADQPRLSLISLISCLPLPDVPTSFLVFLPG